MTPPSAASPQVKPEPQSVAYAMVGIVLAVTMVALSGAYGVDWWLHRRPEASGGSDPVLSRSLVAKTLNIPASWFRGGVDRQRGFSSEIDLRFGLPLGKAGAVLPVDVTLLPLSQVRQSVALLDGVYLHQFMPNEFSGPPGLVGKPLFGTEGYEGETVWYDALSQNPFVAKCSDALVAGQPAQCLRTVALPDGIGAVYSFPATALARWRDFDPAMKVALKRIGAL